VAAIERCAGAGQKVTMVVAGLSVDEGQKTTNLRAAITRLEPRDEVLVSRCRHRGGPRLDRELVAPLAAGSAISSPVSPGRPRDRRPATYILASMSRAVDLSPVAVLNAAWGGSTALACKTFAELGMAQAWRER